MPALFHFVLLSLLTLIPAWAHAADPTTDRIDKIFAAWDKPDTPGAALAVVRDGKIFYSRGYGLANLEHAARNTPATVFHAASVSKQFTAFAIQLLAQDGKLSLDDEVRRHVPELQLPGPAITIRHLLHHTSGLRDQWSLLMLAGLRLDDVITEGDILGLLWQQRQLNFRPGEEDLYSNSGYSLLGLIVKRVSGQSLAAFAKDRIFDPLGMKDTHFHERYGALVRGRAASYRRRGEAWETVALSYSNVGATSLMTTVEDLARWSTNLGSGQVGGAAVNAAMRTRGRLNSGRTINYASGLVIGQYRGLAMAEHSGSDAGYRAHLMHFDQPQVSVLVLGNAASLNASELARRVADVVLERTPGLEPARSHPPEMESQASDLSSWLGDYEMRPGFVLSFTRDGNRLAVQATGQPKFPMFASADNSFFTKAFEAAVTFDKPARYGAPATSATWRQNGRELPLRRITPEVPDSPSLQACTGDFYSSELRTVYQLQLQAGKLMVRYPRGILELRPVDREVFNAGFPLGTLHMQRSSTGACDGFAVNTGRVRNLQFVRVSLPQ